MDDDEDRCPNCGQVVFGVMHICETDQRDAVAEIECVAAQVRSGLEKCGAQHGV